MRVGFAGLGRMGTRMARNLARAGHEVSVWNRSPGPAEAFAADCAGVAETPKALAEDAEVVVTMLSDDAASDAVHDGPDGLLAAEGGARILLEMGTMSPAHLSALRERAGGRLVIDAPVSGATEAAEEATLMIMVGADEAAAEPVCPLLAAMGGPVVHLGRPGAGAVMKLAVNALLHGLNQTLAEALAIAEGAGIGAEAAFDVIEASVACAPMLSYRRPLYLDEAAHAVTFTVALARKDMDAMIDLARSQGRPAPQLTLTRDLLRDAEAKGYGARDMAAMRAYVREALS